MADKSTAQTQNPQIKTAQTTETEKALATFAGGCFWCMEPPFDRLQGVEKTISGYTGGEVENPSYKDVSAGRTGHTEAVQITYDPGKISYEELLKVYWRNVDPLDQRGQFCDKGSQYRAEIFYHTPEQEAAARASLEEVRKQFHGSKIAVKITPAEQFWPAEDYHQDYYQKNPLRYKIYRYGCGRDKRLEELWGSE